MEFADGGSLEAIDKRIRSRGGRTGEKVLGKIAHSVLEGLAYLHTHKIIHRDIKPSNVVVTKDGQFKLCDLGVSGELVGSMAGTFVGTSVYMAVRTLLRWLDLADLSAARAYPRRKVHYSVRRLVARSDAARTDFAPISSGGGRRRRAPSF